MRINPPPDALFELRRCQLSAVPEFVTLVAAELEPSHPMIINEDPVVDTAVLVTLVPLPASYEGEPIIAIPDQTGTAVARIKANIVLRISLPPRRPEFCAARSQ